MALSQYLSSRKSDTRDVTERRSNDKGGDSVVAQKAAYIIIVTLKRKECRVRLPRRQQQMEVLGDVAYTCESLQSPVFPNGTHDRNVNSATLLTSPTHPPRIDVESVL